MNKVVSVLLLVLVAVSMVMSTVAILSQEARAGEGACPPLPNYKHQCPFNPYLWETAPGSGCCCPDFSWEGVATCS